MISRLFDASLFFCDGLCNIFLSVRAFSSFSSKADPAIDEKHLVVPSRGLASRFRAIHKICASLVHAAWEGAEFEEDFLLQKGWSHLAGCRAFLYDAARPRAVWVSRKHGFHL